MKNSRRWPTLTGSHSVSAAAGPASKGPPVRSPHWPWALGAAIAAGAVFLWGLAHARLLLYGDATAHLFIARRMVDSRTPGMSQWGSVWLPFPHLLMAPFTVVMSWWRSGAAGSVVAVACFALATWFLHRLAARHFGPAVANWAALWFLLNPNFLYLASVPMTEAVYVMAFLGAVDQLSLATADDRATSPHVIAAAAWALAAAMTRYDGWFCLPFFALMLLFSVPGQGPQWGRALRFCALAGLGPSFWFAYNQFYFGDWLSFLRGPYSARQIYLRALRHGGQRYPGDHHLFVAMHYFLKASALDCGLPLLLLALAGVAAYGWSRRHTPPRSTAGLGSCTPGAGTTATPPRSSHGGAHWAAPCLLLLPLPWYVWAMWSGNVPIFVPMLWPHGYYNLRYGIQLLAGAALFSGVAVALAARWRHGRSAASAPAADWAPAAGFQRGVWTAAALAVIASYGAMLAGPGPMTYAEAVHNAPARLAMEHQLAAALQPRQTGQLVLMYTGTYPGALPDDGIPLRAVIQESNFRQWDRALAAPQRYAAWVVVQTGSPSATGVNRADLRRYYHSVARFSAPLQPVITVYRRNAP